MRTSSFGRRGRVALSLALGLSCAPPVYAADAPAETKAPAPEPVTTKDPQISLDELEILLAPMTKDELGVEAKGWFDLVRAKEREISVAELNVKRKNREIELLDKQKAAAAELAQASKDVKAATDKGGDADAAAKRLADAQKTLVKTVETAEKQTAKDAEKAEATATALSKQAEGSTAPAAAVAADSKAVLDKAAAAAAEKADPGDQKATEKVEKVAAAGAKEASAAEDVKVLAQAAPVAAGAAVATAAGAGGGAAAAAAKDTSKTAETLAKKVDEAAAAKSDVKVQLVDYSTQLRSESTALTDRLKLVLDKWEAKGGDAKTERLYLASIGGIKIDVSDKAATWARVSAWITADEGGLRWARNLGVFLAYILGSIVVAWIVRRILNRLMSSSRVTSHLLRNFVVTSSGRLVIAVGFLLGLSALEVNLAPLLAVIGAAGFVVAFALQGTLSNFASGLLIMVFKPFDVDDEVEVGGGVKGRVTNVNIFSTYIQTEDGLQKIVPNDNIWKNVIVNQTTGEVKSPQAGGTEPPKQAAA